MLTAASAKTLDDVAASRIAWPAVSIEVRSAQGARTGPSDPEEPVRPTPLRRPEQRPEATDPSPVRGRRRLPLRPALTPLAPDATFPDFLPPAEGREAARLAGGVAIEVPDAPAPRRRVPRWAPPLAWAAVVFAASSLPDLQTRVVGIQIRDKLAHFGEYFIFGWLVARSFDGLGWPAWRHFLWTLILGALLGGLDELYQGFVPGREQDLLDFTADVCGVLAGWYFSREDETLGSPSAPGNA